MNKLEQRKDSCKTYLEQTKLLVTLASAFLIAPAFIYTVLKATTIKYLLFSEFCFVASVLFGYVVFGSIAGSQRDGRYDVYRSATRFFSFLQIFTYILGLIFFVLMFLHLDMTHEKSQPQKKEQTQNYIFKLERNASFNNTIGFYKVNENGDLTDPVTHDPVTPKDPSYLSLAVDNRLNIELTALDNDHNNITVKLSEELVIAPFIVVNGSIGQLVDYDPNNDPEVYVPYAVANSDGFDHIRTLSVSNRVLVFEDLPNGGDQDFDDMILGIEPMQSEQRVKILSFNIDSDHLI